MLIAKGANVNAADRYKKTPLHLLMTFDSSRHVPDNWTVDDGMSEFNFICAIRFLNRISSMRL